MRRIFHGRAGTTLAFMLGLLVATAGTATAAKLITSKQIRDGTITKADLSKALRAQLAKAGLGPQGPAGSQGGNGAQGPQGDRGPSGASGAAVFAGGMAVVPPSGPFITQFRRGPVNGVAAAAVQSSEVAALSPNRPIRVRDLSADVLADVPNGSFVTVRFLSNVPSNYGEGIGATTLECTITGTSGGDDKRCSNAASVDVPAGSVIFMVVTIGSGPATTSPGSAHWGMTVEPIL